MVIEKRKISELNPSKYNPRIEMSETDESFKRLSKSLVEFGCVEPIVVNGNNNAIIGGHQRINVLKKLGYDEIECVIVKLSEKNEKRLNLALNKNTGAWDNDKLKELFDELNLSEEEMLATGFDKAEIDGMYSDFITDLLEEDFSSVGKELDKFAITLNISVDYKEMFDSYLKSNSKDELVNCLIEFVKEEEDA